MHFVYRHRCNGRTYALDTDEIKKEIEDVPSITSSFEVDPPGCGNRVEGINAQA